MNQTKIPLPLIATMSPSEWHDFTLLEGAEPMTPQGAYAPEAPTEVVPKLIVSDAVGPVELLAPAGGPEAAFAALLSGADAVYLGLRKFSARAEAENFTTDELAEIVVYAHALMPRRRVFVAVNTLVRNDELPELIETLAVLAEVGVDALIVQDLGVYHLARNYFPELELHASTQLAVHNQCGAQALRALGFQRVVLARELTLDEIHHITGAGVETEVFVHGALCYSYSGLCLFSAQTLGRSGNRGRCAYSCRDTFEVTGAPDTLRDGSAVKRDPSGGLPFSMKDLALADRVPALRAAGVSCFKIEGRKKSALYVATATTFYRNLIDGTLDATQRAKQESDLQAAFGRPWTRLFIDSPRDKEVAERDLTHHQGTRIGCVESIQRDRRSRRLRFHTARALERSDGLQVDLPGGGRPFSFGIRRLWVIEAGERRAVTAAPANALVEVALPQDHRDHPDLPVGAPVYCAASSAVQRRYHRARPAPNPHPAEREALLLQAARDRSCRVAAEVCSTPPDPIPAPLRWSVKVDRVAFLDRFTAADWVGIDEVIVDIMRDHLTPLRERLDELRRQLGPNQIRLALPALTRQWEDPLLVRKIAYFRQAGWTLWEAANLSAWSYLGLDPAGPARDIDLATDWSMYAVNRAAAVQLLDMGVTRFALSPEDGLANVRPMLAEFGRRAVLIVYQDTPLFQAESCAYANLIGGCPGKANCRFESMEMVSDHGERVTALDYHCRTIVLNQGPFCLAPRLGEIAAAGAVSVRADFVYRAYAPETVVARWKAVRAGQDVPGAHAANFDRGFL
jgi:collagenase-like PrtC family protease